MLTIVTPHWVARLNTTSSAVLTACQTEGITVIGMWDDKTKTHIIPEKVTRG